MPWRRPDPEYSGPFCQRVSKNYDSLLGQPERCLEPSSSIVKSDNAAWEYLVRFEYLQLALRHIVGPEESRAESTDPIAADKLVNVAHVIGDGYRSDSRRATFYTLPQFFGGCFGDEGVDDQFLASRFDIG